MTINNVPYIIVFLYPLIGFIVNALKIDKYDKFFKVEYVFYLYLLFAGLRGNGDGDYFNYLGGIPQIDSFYKIFVIKDYPFEIGFRVIAYFNNLFGVTGQFTIFVLSLISLLNIKYSITKYSKNKWLSWVLYFSFLLSFDMHHSRNAVAISFIVRLFFDYFIEKDNKKSMLWMILAFCFHKSSIFAIFAIVILKLLKTLNIKSDVKYKYIYILVALIIISFFNPINIIVQLFEFMLPNNSLVYKLSAYLSNPRWSYPFKLYDPRFIILLLTYIVSKMRISKEDFIGNFYLSAVYISICTMIILSESTILTMRFYNYFNIFIIFIIPYTLSLESTSNISDILLKLVISGYVIYILALILKQVPYYLFI